ncbi:MAG: DNA polymerase ligase N-terminal domain-containing protein [Candidatus Babeliales bacterium]
MKRIIIFFILCDVLIGEIGMSVQKNTLKKYKSKRDFRATPEPKGNAKNSSKKPIFVIQKHDATNLHYDFRLEIDGVLVSWAVPKGPSTDPSEKRLAIQTEDHPLEYAKFEGVIPEGNYGAGTVMVWDRGTFKNIKTKEDKKISLSDSLENGQVEVWLEGKKLRGGYVLIQINKEKKQWLLKKIDDQEADARRNPVSTEPKSVLTGRTLKEIAQEKKAKKNK